MASDQISPCVVAYINGTLICLHIKLIITASLTLHLVKGMCRSVSVACDGSFQWLLWSRTGLIQMIMAHWTDSFIPKVIKRRKNKYFSNCVRQHGKSSYPLSIMHWHEAFSTYHCGLHFILGTFTSSNKIEPSLVIIVLEDEWTKISNLLLLNLR